jgi:hypothetical protein
MRIAEWEDRSTFDVRFFGERHETLERPPLAPPYEGGE